MCLTVVAVEGHGIGFEVDSYVVHWVPGNAKDNGVFEHNYK